MLITSKVDHNSCLIDDQRMLWNYVVLWDDAATVTSFFIFFKKGNSASILSDKYINN